LSTTRIVSSVPLSDRCIISPSFIVALIFISRPGQMASGRHRR
jgi:hypothetical protein